MYKVQNRIASDIINDNFGKRNITYNTRIPLSLTQGISKTIAYLGRKIWDLVSLKEDKDKKKKNIFKSNMNLWKLRNYSCRLCKLYLPQIRVLGNDNPILYFCLF